MANVHLDQELAQIEGQIVWLGGLVETAIFKAVAAMRAKDMDALKTLIEDDDRIDDLENDIQMSCVELIRREAPLAADLRRIIATMFIANELERMGDYAEGIAKVAINIGYEAPLQQMDYIQRMSDLAVSMMKRSIETLTTSDSDAASEIAMGIETDDDQVDDLYAKVQGEIFDLLRADPTRSEQATYLLWAAHNIERIADRSTNIAERAIYVTKAVMVGGSRHAIELLNAAD